MHDLHPATASPAASEETPTFPSRRRRDGRAHPRPDWADAAGAARALAAQPEDRRAHHAHLAPADVDRLGPGAHLSLQRSVQGDHRRQAPRALGQPTSVVWQEIWDDIGPMLATAMGGDEGTYVEAQLLIMERHGYPEETYYTFSYSPIPDDDGSTGGIICANTDDTAARHRRAPARAAAGARRRHRRRAHRGARPARERRGAATNPHDLPFALIYLAEPDERRLALAGASGHRAWSPRAAPSDRLDATRRPGRSPRCCASRACSWSPTSPSRFGAAAAGAWTEPPPRPRSCPSCRRGETRPGRRPGRRPQPVSPVRRRLSRLPRAWSPARSRPPSPTPQRLRGGAPARRGAGRDRPRQDDLLLQRQPRVPHAADADARPARGRCSAKPRDVPRRHPASCVDARRTATALRLLKLVNTLLDFSRIEAGRVAGELRADRPGRAHRRARQRPSARRCERAGLRFEVDCPPLAEPVYVDRDMWEKIVLNLLSNAFKFTFEGRSASSSAAAPGDARASSGCATPARASRTTSCRASSSASIASRARAGRTHEGTGIGLALVQELVEAARRHDQRRERARPRQHLHRHDSVRGGAPAAASSVRAARALASTVAAGQAFVEEALRWLPDDAASGGHERRRLRSAAAIARLARVRARRRALVVADDNADMRDYVRACCGSRLRRRGRRRRRSRARGAPALQARSRALPT